MGDSLGYFRSLARDCLNVILPGWVNRAEIWAVLRMASAGLVPYASTHYFVGSYPTKVIEYMCGGLPIMMSLKGVLSDLISAHGCGIWYQGGDPAGLAAKLSDLCDHPERV